MAHSLAEPHWGESLGGEVADRRMRVDSHRFGRVVVTAQNGVSSLSFNAVRLRVGGWLRVIALVALVLEASPTAAQPVANSVPGPAGFVTFTEEVPCPPKVAAALANRARRLRPRPRMRRHVRRVHKPAQPVKVAATPAHRKAPTRRVRRRPRPVIRVAAVDPASQPRCTVVRRDRLTPASFAFAADPVALAPLTEEALPLAPALVDPVVGGGRSAIGPPVGGSIGGRPVSIGGGAGGAGGGGPGVPVVTGSVPEPATWLFLLAGIGMVGTVLRRRSRGQPSEERAS